MLCCAVLRPLQVDCYCVDNALVRLGDPVFAGFCHERGIDCGARSCIC